MRGLADIDLRDKVALLRADLNVPLADGQVTDTTRITASVPTIKAVLAAGGGCVVMSHLGRPTEGQHDPALSLAPVARCLAEALGCEVPLQQLSHAYRPTPGQVMMLENTRFNTGEKANSLELAHDYSRLGDVFVMDAFASAHRAESSTVGLARIGIESCAGLLLQAEVDALRQATDNPARPLLAIVGGAKVSTKMAVLGQLAETADHVLVGGGIANTFLAAIGHQVGKSLAEREMTAECNLILDRHGAKFHLPTDVITATSLDATTGTARAVDEVGDDEMILDVGPASLAAAQELVRNAATVVWNGALGVFERPAFSAGTRGLAEAIGATAAFTLAGGGETVAAAKAYGVADRVDCLSTGGGAFLEYVEGRELPALLALG